MGRRKRSPCSRRPPEGCGSAGPVRERPGKGLIGLVLLAAAADG